MVSSIRTLNGTVTASTTPGQSEPWSNGNEMVLHITQRSRTGYSIFNGLVSSGPAMEDPYPFEDIQLAYSTALSN